MPLSGLAFGFPKKAIFKFGIPLAPGAIEFMQHCLLVA